MLHDNQIERMLVDSQAFIDAIDQNAALRAGGRCAEHVEALAENRQELKAMLITARHKLNLMHNATIVLRNAMRQNEWGPGVAILQRSAIREATRIIEEAMEDTA